MRSVIITKRQIREILLATAAYSGSLLLSAFSGFLPFFAIIAGFPVIIIYLRQGRRSGQVMAFISLLATWLLVDPLTFIFVGLGIATAYSLLLWRSETQSLSVAYGYGYLAIMLWLGISQLSMLFIEKSSLFSAVSEAFQTAFTILEENMATLNLYTEEQIKVITEFGQQMLPFLEANWPLILFIFATLSITGGLWLLARREPAAALRFRRWFDVKAPSWLAIIALLAFAYRYWAGEATPFIVSGALAVANAVALLAGYSLLVFYLEYWRISRSLRILLTVYLFFALWLRPALILVGYFDAIFNYRHFIWAKLKRE